MRLMAFVLALLLAASPVLAAPLAIGNNTNQEIISILAQAQDLEFFMRLDLPPGGRDEVENPACAASLRADTGLQLWFFPQVDLARAKSIAFCADHQICLIVTDKNGHIAHVAGTMRELVPQKGDPPACNLDHFHPAMRMRDVCAILPGQMLHDDNGALLATMGFAGMPWAARLVPNQSGPVNERSLLDHLELRRPLALADIERLIDALFAKGYAPWQAEFPGLDLEFEADVPKDQQKKLLLAAVRRFLAPHAERGHINHADGEKCEEASIIMALAKMLPELETVEEPHEDAQIFTIILRPCARALLLDVAAYHGQNSK